MRKLEIRLRYLLWGLKRINKPHLGDLVIYNNESYFLIQGVSHPRWDLLNCKTRIVLKNINCNDFVLKHKIKGRIDRIVKSYDFQISNWFRIDSFNKLGKKISYNGR